MAGVPQPAYPPSRCRVGADRPARTCWGSIMRAIVTVSCASARAPAAVPRSRGSRRQQTQHRARIVPVEGPVQPRRRAAIMVLSTKCRADGNRAGGSVHLAGTPTKAPEGPRAAGQSTKVATTVSNAPSGTPRSSRFICTSRESLRIVWDLSTTCLSTGRLRSMPTQIAAAADAQDPAVCMAEKFGM
jgi:hypothetical protein